MGRRWRRSVLASTAFILAGIGGAVGGHITDKFSLAAVVFVVLLLLGGFVALMLDRLSGNGEAADADDNDAVSHVDARWSRAVQVGDNNVQINQGESLETGDG
jgi:hypothetical protein